MHVRSFGLEYCERLHLVVIPKRVRLGRYRLKNDYWFYCLAVYREIVEDNSLSMAFFPY